MKIPSVLRQAPTGSDTSASERNEQSLDGNDPAHAPADDKECPPYVEDDSPPPYEHFQKRGGNATDPETVNHAPPPHGGRNDGNGGGAGQTTDDIELRRQQGTTPGNLGPHDQQTLKMGSVLTVNLDEPPDATHLDQKAKLTIEYFNPQNVLTAESAFPLLPRRNATMSLLQARQDLNSLTLRGIIRLHYDVVEEESDPSPRGESTGRPIENSQQASSDPPPKGESTGRPIENSQQASTSGQGGDTGPPRSSRKGRTLQKRDRRGQNAGASGQGGNSAPPGGG